MNVFSELSQNGDATSDSKGSSNLKDTPCTVLDLWRAESLGTSIVLLILLMSKYEENGY